ncbi:HAD family acid phosphatase [Nocardia sp. CDC160]|uniref:HAD family acid phosphatase n=1 Tax=Nocardia sp. CDC160 TaxID=3112166 RepID=UPI002DB6B966|nr:HAD family acid phosphatase [Nocardia sp. CDC160]MEC3915029.1 HAD family acid phosphatase [Nocardia sp. CDC160]
MRRSLAVVAAGLAVGLAAPIPVALADSGSSGLGSGSASGSGTGSLSGSGGGGNLPPYSQWISDVTTVATAAQTYLTTALPGATKPAIVFDVDNTVLETTYHPAPITPAIPPILKLAQWAKSQGASIIFVTGRPSVINFYTQINLSSVGYSVDGLYGGGLTTGSSGAAALADYKTATRASIEAQGYTIVANIGNSASDLSGGHAQQTFKLPDYNGALQ